MLSDRSREKATEDFSNEPKDEIRKATIGFRPHDIENVDYIRGRTHAHNNAQAVGIALSLARFLVEAIERGEQVLIRNRDNELERIRIPYLER